MSDNDPFAALAADYEEWFETPLGAFVDRLELAALDELLPGPRGGFIVEVGAGTGHIARHLAARGYRVLAVEPSAGMREEGQRRSRDTAVEWSDACGEALPLEDEAADGVLFFASLEFVGDAAAALGEARRAVGPGGWIAVGLLHALSPWAALYRALAEDGIEPWCSARLYRPEAVAEMMGREPDATRAAGHLAPAATEPFAEADAAGRRTGNAPAMQLLLWRDQR